MKYKACCERRCLVEGCTIRENGGCIHACSLDDRIFHLKKFIEGKSFCYGSVYVPNHEKYFNSLSTEKQKEELKYREEAKKVLAEDEIEFYEKFIYDPKKENDE